MDWTSNHSGSSIEGGTTRGGRSDNQTIILTNMNNVRQCLSDDRDQRRRFVMSELTTAITSANESFMETYGRGDAAGMAQLYTTDGQLLPGGSDVVTGHEGIEAFWGGVMEMGIATARLETVELEDHGDTAIEVGRYTLGKADGEVADEGKYIVIWKNQAGTWKLHRDIWNTNRS